MSHLSQNESIKLIATWLNALSVAAIAAGVFAPLVYNVYDFGPKMAPDTPLGSFAVVCICLGLALHLIGHLVLGGLRDDE